MKRFSERQTNKTALPKRAFRVRKLKTSRGKRITLCNKRESDRKKKDSERQTERTLDRQTDRETEGNPRQTERDRGQP